MTGSVLCLSYWMVGLYGIKPRPKGVISGGKPWETWIYTGKGGPVEARIKDVCSYTVKVKSKGIQDVVGLRASRATELVPPARLEKFGPDQQEKKKSPGGKT